jgi:UDP-2,3-diacylglucosamine pyrophosphatase LpxH
MFVVSDLHLGGRPPDPATGDLGFQMCSETGRRRLDAWVGWCTQQLSSERRAEIVIAGDIVDFLAEEPFAPFTADDAAAAKKLDTILERTRPLWDRLAAFVAAGGELTLMLGNHDVELSLPGPRRLLLDRLGRGSAPRFAVDFLDDNRAHTVGPVIIEHGNRYDAWNAVPHGELRRARSALSRGEAGAAPVDLGMPGSHLVVEVMNEIKKRYRFVDLLKPEEEAVLPLLAALDPPSLPALRRIASLVSDARSRQRRDHDRRTGAPLRPEQIGAVAGWREPDEAADEGPLALAAELAIERGYTPGAEGEIAAGGVWARLRELGTSQLHRALRALADAHGFAFSVTEESELYALPAKALAERFEVVVFGHTHLAKRVALPGGRLYLNTGTWADLMRLPPAIIDGKRDSGSEAELKLFAHDLRENTLDRHVRQLPTFGRIDLGAGGRVKADVLLFEKDCSGARPLPAKSLWEVWDEYG